MSHLNYLSEFSTKRVHVYQCAHTNDAALDADCGRTSCRLCKKLDTPRCYHCIHGCIVSSSTDEIHKCATYIENV